MQRCDKEYAMGIDKQHLKAMANCSRSSVIRLIAALMIIMPASVLFITTGWVVYYHHYEHISRPATKNLESISIDKAWTNSTMISTSSSNIPSAERQALQDLFESTHGVHWNYGSSSSAGNHWSFDDPAVNPCLEQWYGVHCVGNHIIGLSLADSNLIGIIPESLSRLTMLVYLDLRRNLLIGTVPVTLCKIKSLVRLDLEGNRIVCYPHCLEHIVVELKMYPSIPVCNSIPSPISLFDPYTDKVSSSALVMASTGYIKPPLKRQVLQDLSNVTPTFRPSRTPTYVPSRKPTRSPSCTPTTSSPSNPPTRRPQISEQPTNQPSGQSSMQPSSQPSDQPTMQPSSQPSDEPTMQPSSQPSNEPTKQPSSQPSDQPTMQPSSQPSDEPTMQPSSQPSDQPTIQPSSLPSNQQTIQPSGQPTGVPTTLPSSQPTMQSSSHPSKDSGNSIISALIIYRAHCGAYS